MKHELNDSRTSKFTSYLIVGSGRLAQHLQFYLNGLGLPVRTWSRRDNTPTDLAQRLTQASHVLLAVKDSAIAEVHQELQSLTADSSHRFVHLSGALHIPGVQAAHPLMTFGPELQALDWYRQIPFVVDAGHTLLELLPGVPNAHWSIRPEQRALYHALCSLAGNSTYLLWRHIGERLEAQLDLPREILEPFLVQTARNATQKNLEAFTGPVARGDWPVVERHLEALQADTTLTQAYKSYLRLAQPSHPQIPEEFL